MNLYVSLIRTGVPALVGWLIAVGAAWGLHLDEGALTGVLTPVVSVVYYALFRLAEEHASPRFGWLLGYAKPPAYDAK
ncbi:hypothetical protein GCM10020367_20750 [Streptomyces sannanensis]|uniref:Uncharacterized protein n=1 Tax=Streptomyces sannanensis TaxID=285536 RepID=A0ABP6S926_9ACTN